MQSLRRVPYAVKIITGPYWCPPRQPDVAPRGIAPEPRPSGLRGLNVEVRTSAEHVAGFKEYEARLTNRRTCDPLQFLPLAFELLQCFPFPQPTQPTTKRRNLHERKRALRIEVHVGQPEKVRPPFEPFVRRFWVRSRQHAFFDKHFYFVFGQQ